MNQTLIVILAAMAAVALLVVGMSLTLMIKGHHIDSEIATNKNMQRLGIKCAVQEAREAMGAACAPPSEAGAQLPSGCAGNCAACDTVVHEKALSDES